MVRFLPAAALFMIVFCPLGAMCWTSSCVSIKTNGGRIEYAPSANEPWAECTETLSSPREPGYVYLEVRASRSAPAVLVVTSSEGVKAFYHFALPVFRSKIKVDSKQSDMTSGGRFLRDIKAVSLAFEAGAYKDGRGAEAEIFGLAFAEEPPEKTLYSRFWLPSLGAGFLRDCEAETCVWNIWPPSSGPGWESGQAQFGGYDAPGGRDIIRGVIDFLSLYYGGGGLDLPYIEDPSLTEYARSKNVTVYAEMHHTPDIGWLKENRALNVNRYGQTCPDMGVADMSHAYDFTDDRVVEKTSEKMLRSAAAGVKYIRSIDYVWTPFGPNGSWNGMIWGYSASAVKRWREDLAAKDSGIELIENGKRRRLYFPEYFTAYHGYFPEPCHAGCERWEDYVPPMDGDTENRIEKAKLHMMLYHYEWLKFINAAAEKSVEKYGVYAQPILNAESAGNGGDYIYLSRLSNVAGYCPEWWGTPNVIIGNYYNGRYYEKGAAGKERCLFGESGAGGANPFYGKYQRPNYWDNPAGCLIAYSQAGSSLFRSKQDQYWGSSPERMTDPKEKEYLIYTAFVSSWNGFLRAKEDGLKKPSCRVCSFIQRAPAGYTNSMDTEAGAPYSFNGILEKNNYLFDGASFPEVLGINNYDICFYSPVTSPRGALDMLWKWLKTGNKTLVTHSFVPLNADGPGKDVNKAEIRPQIPEKAAARKTGFDTIAKTDVSEGEFKTALKGLERFRGHLALEDTLYSIEGYTPLATLDGKPLISVKNLDNGSRIIYLGFAPCQRDALGNTEICVSEKGVQDSGFDSAAVCAVMEYLGEKRQGVTEDDLSVMRYETAGKGGVYILLNRSANRQWQGEEEIFTVFQAYSEKVRYTAPPRVLTEKPDAGYVIRDFLSGEETIGTSDGMGYLEIPMDGYNIRGVYIYPAERLK
ncbi:MAG: hypothetical protein ILO36_09465 [Abditibacteriota bacterium]|nr:hypothetical protein [Abditibacteriota bacterium]